MTEKVKIEIPEEIYSIALKFYEENSLKLKEIGVNSVSQLFEEAIKYFIEGYREPIIT